MKRSPVCNVHGWALSANQIKAYFNLDYNEKWPAEGMDGVSVQGVWMYVKPLVPKEERVYKWHYHTAYHNWHRLTAVCPDCGKEVSYGRLAQHYAIHC